MSGLMLIHGGIPTTIIYAVITVNAHMAYAPIEQLQHRFLVMFFALLHN